MAAASAMSPDSGFSQNTGIPASTPALISWVWALVAAAMMIASTPLLIRLSGLSAASAPTFSATVLVTAGTKSVTTRESTLGQCGQGVGVKRADPAEPDQAEAHDALLLEMCCAVTLVSGGVGHPEAADDVLVPVDDRPGDDAAAVGQQEDDEVGDLVGLAEFAHRQGGAGRGLPVSAGTLGAASPRTAAASALGLVLAVGGRPAHVQAVDPDPVPAVGVGGVLGQPGQPGLRRDVGREKRLAAVGVDGDDVDDAARFAAPLHVGDRRLHEEERGPQVHRDVLVEQFRGGVQHAAAGGQPGRVDQASIRPYRWIVAATEACAAPRR